MSCLPLGNGREAGIICLSLELLTKVEQRAARDGSRHGGGALSGTDQGKPRMCVLERRF